ncbi:UPF0109 protein [Candidatus Levyibacteriota bacterium]|nr:KH domain-containing protein [Candidatus Levybacteria bacterium]MSU26173.1 KH domain-containing protein [Candidatus Levybacteria bacterium]GDX62131.1 UPF0109 protein [Candidatus Levybacteria bacterium]
MKDTLSYIISALVDNQEEVRIEEIEEDGIITFNIKVAKEDMGKVIGKEGKIIRAIRNVMKIPAIKMNKRVAISLQEEEK